MSGSRTRADRSHSLSGVSRLSSANPGPHLTMASRRRRPASARASLPLPAAPDARRWTLKASLATLSTPGRVLLHFFMKRREQMPDRLMAVREGGLGVAARCMVAWGTLVVVCLLALDPLGAQEVGRATPEYMAPFLLPVTKPGDPQVERGRYLM